ncbi:DUF2946 family protein [Porphyrobacter sp. YT40]|uniref:DUF2946 family protein n=1 Tax=Porphyrobacter sp. YT40 TaxID=2547601 RepID=UPI0011432DDA|nr:DUF2946 family protein [Porphyrobacter sp. YT40]QDH34014.1 hypothetical protein E2E27_06495 [Porphyrobacter sp. YT40]
MFSLRALTHGYARLSLALVVLALAVKALVPAGYMISSNGERFLTVTICADASGTPKQMRIAIPMKDDGKSDHSEAADKSQPCAFSGLGHAALGGADPVLLAAALAFILLVGLAPLRAPPARDIHFLRPPLRGPPSLSV